MIEISQEQAIEIRKDLLDNFNQLCKEHGLKYSLAYGTFLGAVRHGGMIPWDDDIDLIMPRSDYEKLCAMYLARDCAEKYQFVSHHNHPEVKTKIGYYIDYSTITETAGKQNAYHGIHIDIYPLDILPNGRLQQKFLFLKRKLFHFVIKAKNVHPEVLKGSQKLIRMIVKLVFAPIPSDFAYKCLHNVSKQYMSVADSERNTVCCLVESGKPICFPYHVSTQYAMYDYEGKQYPAFADYDAPLRAWYGEYMTLPPVEQRIRPQHKHVRYYYKDQNNEKSV